MTPPPLLPRLLFKGYQPGHSCSESHIGFILQKEIAVVCETSWQQAKAYVAFVDVRKAFDTLACFPTQEAASQRVTALLAPHQHMVLDLHAPAVSCGIWQALLDFRPQAEGLTGYMALSHNFST